MQILTENDREKIIRLLQEGKPLPEIYKSRLFPAEDKEYIELTKVYQLVYQGKKRKEDIIAETLEAPLQEVRTFNTENASPDAWRNMLIFGDNLLALKTLYEDQRGPNKYGTRNKIKLIYIDPPFATKQDFMKDREKAYRDKIIGAQFIEFLRKRLILLREVLADDGSIYLHLDTKKIHYAKVVMDEIFGEFNFKNEIIWKRTSAHSDSKTYANVHDTVLFYTKSENASFMPQYNQYSDDHIAERYKHLENDGRRFADDNLIGAGLRGGGYEYEWKGVTKIWRCPIETMRRYEAEDRIYYTNKGVARIKRYLDELPGQPVMDLWQDVFPVNSQAAERINYPTQKPERIVERIIRTSSNENDIILDAFAGSGTTLSVAEKLGRRWIGIDCGKLAIYTIQKRMLNLTTIIGSVKKDERNLTERVDKFDDHLKNSKALLIVSEKANKGELVINDAFIKALHSLVSLTQKGGEFSLVCPEDKFKVRSYEEDEDGRRIIKKDQITYVISFVEPKEKAEREKPLIATAFTLFNAGIYDNEAILDLDWQAYREFVLKLFEVREDRHSINGFPVDGYVGVDSAYIWDYPNCKNETLDEGYVDSLHHTLGGKAGDRFYLIAPVISFSFLMDEITLGETTYVFLKVPISVLTRLIERKSLGAFPQPCAEADVNEVIDAVGFDFISPPVVKMQCLRLSPEKPDLLNKDIREYVIRIKEFRSDTLASSPEDFENFETLSMVLVDYDFNGKVFDLDSVYWGEDLVNTELKRKGITSTAKFAERVKDCEYLDVRLPEDKAKDNMMIIFVDKYGNEKKQILKRKDFLKNA
ncbi:MAG: site-specific DNA-methyltransferase [Bacteroidales bacterium]|nr:site-specific DNA-methyltransferase [Bacteroidales bacterium]